MRPLLVVVLLSLGFQEVFAFVPVVSISTTNAPAPAVTGPCSSLRRRSNDKSPSSLAVGGQNQPDMRYLQYDLTIIQGPQDFLDFLGRDDRLCVVFVRANWCQICKQFSMKWRKMCNAYADKYNPNTGELVVPGTVRFAEIEFTEHEDLCRRLKSSRMPHVLFYQGGQGMVGKITQYQCGPSAFGLVVDSVEYLLAGQFDQYSPPWEEFVAAQEQMLREKEQQQGQQQEAPGDQQY